MGVQSHNFQPAFSPVEWVHRKTDPDREKNDAESRRCEDRHGDGDADPQIHANRQSATIAGRTTLRAQAASKRPHKDERQTCEPGRHPRKIAAATTTAEIVPRSLPELNPDQHVRIRDHVTGSWKPAIVKDVITDEPRSYNVEQPSGGILRRNRRHIRTTGEHHQVDNGSEGGPSEGSD